MKTKLFFLLVMISFIMPHIIFAQVVVLDNYTVEVDGVRYHKYARVSGHAYAEVVNKSSGKYSGAVVIREKVSISGYECSVVNIGDKAFYGCSGLTSITIPNSVMSIGEYAFSYCSGLTSITIPNSVTSIGDYAFEGCSGLTSVTIPNSVTSIGRHAFYGCSGLTSVNITDLTSWCNITFNGEYANPTYYVHKLVLNGTEVKDLVVPEGVSVIKNLAFSGCSGLTSITIPNSVTSIGGWAFYSCYIQKDKFINNSSCNSADNWGATLFDEETADGLIIKDNVAIKCRPWATSITIPNSVTSIGSSAFSGCTSLTSVTIPNSVTSIGGNAFSGCSNLPVIDNIRYADCVAVEAIDKSRFTYVIKEGTRFIHSNAFQSCSALTSVTIPNSVTSIGDLAFEGCSGLTSVTIPNSVTSIGERAFYDCSGLTSITIPNSVTSIGDRAFRNCSGLTSVTIPNSVTSIGSTAFEGCSGLTSVTIPNSVTSIGSCAFNGCRGLTSVTIGNSVTSIGGNAFGNCERLASVNISDLASWCNIDFGDIWANPTYYDHKLVLNGTEIKDLVIPEEVTKVKNAAFAGCRGLTSVTIPNSVTSIGNYAFFDCSGLTSITIPNSVTSIGGSAFYWCNRLTSVNIPNSVTSIGEEAFYYCTGLTSVTIPNSVTSIGEEAFYYCRSLTSVTIPNSVTSIGGKAFENCRSLTSVTIGNSVTSIGYSAFSGCSGLTSVTIPNSVTSIGNSAFSGCSAISEVYSLAEVPPTANSSYTFSNEVYSKATLYVPNTGNALAKYSKSNIWRQFVNIKEFDPNKCISVTTSDKGYATFYSSESAYTLPNGLSACVVTACSGNKLTYRTIASGSEGGVIPKGTAVVLVNGRKAASNFTLIPSESKDSYTGTNYLHGSDEATTTTAGGSNYYYKLTYGEGAESDTFGWYWGARDGSAFQIEGHRAWLAVPKASAARSVFFMDDLTAIEDVPVREDNDILYNLQGRRVSSMNKAGIYIVNGKKVITSK